MQVEPYLYFNGRCDEALAFYKKTLGAEVTRLSRYQDNPEPWPPGMGPAGAEDKVMHAEFRIGSHILMASDGACTGVTDFKGFALSISVPDEAAARRTFDALADGGQVQVPLAKTFWSPLFGMLADRFGLAWMVNVTPVA